MCLQTEKAAKQLPELTHFLVGVLCRGRFFSVLTALSSQEEDI